MSEKSLINTEIDRGTQIVGAVYAALLVGIIVQASLNGLF